MRGAVRPLLLRFHSTQREIHIISITDVLASNIMNYGAS